jgi:hypothetical protein
MPFPIRGTETSQNWLEELANDPEAEGSLELAASRREHGEPFSAGSFASGEEQAGLPDARRTLHEQQTAFA